VDGNSIRFGLSSIKNVGRATVEALVAEREKNGKFTGLTDFIKRLSDSDSDVNKRCLESLIRAGAFDSLGGKRSQYIAVFHGIQNGLALQKKSTLSGQLSLFDMDDAQETAPDTDELPNMAEFPKRLLLFDEKALLGIYVSGHPLAEYEPTLRPHCTVNSLDFGEPADENEETTEARGGSLSDGDTAKYGGIITAKSVKYTKADNKPFCFLTVEDMYGSVEVIVFSKIYEKFGTRLAEDQVLVIQGRISAREEENTKLVAQDFLFYEERPPAPHDNGAGQLSTKSSKVTFWLKIPAGQTVALSAVTDILSRHPGHTRVMIYNEAQKKKILANAGFWVTPNDSLTREMEALLGAGSVKVTE
jgi:DNA polymerase-3 subunit alpha